MVACELAVLLISSVTISRIMLQKPSLTTSNKANCAAARSETKVVAEVVVYDAVEERVPLRTGDIGNQEEQIQCKSLKHHLPFVSRLALERISSAHPQVCSSVASTRVVAETLGVVWLWTPFQGYPAEGWRSTYQVEVSTDEVAPVLATPDNDLRVRVVLTPVENTNTASLLLTILGGAPTASLTFLVGDKRQVLVGIGDTYRSAVPIDQIAAARFQM